MPKSGKLPAGHFWNSSSIEHNRIPLKDILKNIPNIEIEEKSYTAKDLAKMTEGAPTANGIDTSHSYMFKTGWEGVGSYSSKLMGVMGFFIKGSSISTGGIAIIFTYVGDILVNVWIDKNRWGGWKIFTGQPLT